jgi:hypothetical protein
LTTCLFILQAPLSTITGLNTTTPPLKGPSRYLLHNLVKDPAVPRTIIVNKLRVLEESQRTRNPLLYVADQLNRCSGGGEYNLSEAEAAAYIANSPLMKDPTGRPTSEVSLAAAPADGGGGRPGPRVQTPPRPAARLLPAAHAAAAGGGLNNSSPRPPESTENTPMFCKTPARFLAPSRTLLPSAAATAAAQANANLTPAAAEGTTRTIGGGGGRQLAGELAASSRPAVAKAAGHVGKGVGGGIGVFRPSDADLGYPPPKAQAPANKAAEKRPTAVAPSSDRYLDRLYSRTFL